MYPLLSPPIRQDSDGSCSPIPSPVRGRVRLLYPISAADRGGFFMLNFIYNPIAGKGRAQRGRASVEKLLNARGVAFCFHETKGKGDGREIARRLTRAGETEIIAMGGDGTVHEVLNGLEDPSCVNMGIIPCGSGDDFAAAIGVPSDPEEAVKLILSGKTKPTDYMDCSGVRGMNIIGAGIDVEILRRCSRAKFLKGSLNYFASLIVSLLKFNFYHFSTRINGNETKHEGLIVCICNGKRFGGGISICPEAVCDDGLLNVVMVEDVKKSMIPGALVRLMRGSILKQRFTRHELTKHMRAEFEGGVTVQIDGELYDDLPFDVRVVEDGMNMYRN